MTGTGRGSGRGSGRGTGRGTGILRRGHSPCNSFYLVFPLVSLTYFLNLIDKYFVWFHICRLELLGEGNYGRFDKSTQEWDGMMRDLFDGVGRIFHKTTDFSPQGIVSLNSCENEFADISHCSLCIAMGCRFVLKKIW